MRFLGSLLLLGISATVGCGDSSVDPSGGGGTGATGSSSSTAGGNGTGGAGGAAPTPGVDTTVTAFDKTHIYFAGDDNKRIVDLPASFPSEGTYSKITLHLALDCPNNACDPWDRFGSLGLVTSKGATPEEDTVIELARFITPFKLTASWEIDVTDLRPLLSGDVTLRAFIDTWVGPGSQYGDGWLVTATFEMTGGIPEKIPVAAVPVWTRSYVVYGDPAKPVSAALPDKEIVIPEASSFALRTFVTGHGQGNAGNCAEFCERDHTITAGLTSTTAAIWRDDCATTAVPNQPGTWKYARSGWCPGAPVHPWMVDITAEALAAETLNVSYGIEDYENTCRPDSQVCSGCTLGTGCEYDGGAHTEPNFQVSSLLIAYQ